MKPLPIALALIGLGCGGAVPAIADSPQGDFDQWAPPTARARLESAPQSFRISPIGSEGMFTTRRVQFGTERAPVHFAFADGWLGAQAGLERGAPVVELTELRATLGEFKLSPSQLPPDGLIFARGKVVLTEPVVLPATWMGEDLAMVHGTVPVEVHLWLRLSNGAESPLEVAQLALPISLTVFRDEHGVLGVYFEGTLDGPVWNWAGLFELGGLRVQVRAVEKAASVDPATVWLN